MYWQFQAELDMTRKELEQRKAAYELLRREYDRHRAAVRGEAGAVDLQARLERWVAWDRFAGAGLRRRFALHAVGERKGDTAAPCDGRERVRITSIFLTLVFVVRAERERDDLAKIMRERQGMGVSGRGDALGDAAKERAMREEAERLLLEERVKREGGDAKLHEADEVLTTTTHSTPFTRTHTRKF